MAICPAGHTSTAEDYCDVCGLPVSSGAGSAPPVATTDAAPAGAICPNCGTVNAPDALFCEACGYDFTTGTMPRSVALPAAWGASESAVIPEPPLPQAWPTAEFPGLASDDESAPPRPGNPPPSSRGTPGSPPRTTPARGTPNSTPPPNSSTPSPPRIPGPRPRATSSLRTTTGPTPPPGTLTPSSRRTPVSRPGTKPPGPIGPVRSQACPAT